MKRSPEAFRSSQLFETGVGYAVICRYKGGGGCEAGIFLIDTYCLGVKDSDFAVFSSAAEFENDVLGRLFRNEEPVRMTAAAGRKLIEDAVAYADRLGIAPGRDFKKACRVLGGITTAGCEEEFAFGREGRPFYIQGPHDSAARAQWILQTLDRKCGPGCYDYLLASEADEFNAPDEELGEGWRDVAPGPDRSDSAELHEMARRFEAEEPGVVVHVNPPRPKVSDRLSLVAEPLVETAPDYESKRMVLHLAALAWNMMVEEGSGWEEVPEEVRPILNNPAGRAMFDFLANRMAALYPEEDRLICKMEIDPPSGDNLNLRVMSISPEDNLSAPKGRRRQRRARLFPV